MKPVSPAFMGFEEAVRQYLEAAAITDVDASEVAEAQAALLAELPHVTAWKAGEA
ncbi:MAG: hypothetical protein V3T83_13940 [Acidobacteriota bacterium]